MDPGYRNAYDLSRHSPRKSLERLEEEAKYNPKPYDLSFQVELKKARKHILEDNKIYK